MITRVIYRSVLAVVGCSVAGVLAATVVLNAASAEAYSPNVAVGWSKWDQGTNFLLDAQTTKDVGHDENRANSVCGAGLNAAIKANLPVPDEARQVCDQAVLACVHDAVQVRGNALSGVRFYTGGNSDYPVGRYRCLVR